MSLKRIVAVTAGLAATGAVVGSVLGALTIIGWIVVESRRLTGSDWPVIGVAAVAGAAIGAVLAPIFAWALLRTVPLGRAILGTAVGTVAGVVVGPLIHAAGLIPGALAGFAIAAVALRLTASRRTTPSTHQLGP